MKGLTEMFAYQTAKRLFATAGIVLLMFSSCIPALAAEPIEQDANALERMKSEIAKMENVKEVSVIIGQHGLIYDPSGKTKPFMKNCMTVGVILEQPPAPKMEVRIAKIILEKYPLAEKYDILCVQLIPINGWYHSYQIVSISFCKLPSDIGMLI
jgi:hypothetical protein